MSGSDKKFLPQADGQARIAAIEEKLERLRKLHGWSTDTVTVPAMADDDAPERTGAGRKGAELGVPLVLMDGAGRELYRLMGASVEVGSAATAGLRLEVEGVEAQHCRIARDGAGFRVRDLRSVGGTWLNGAQVPLSAALKHGDQLQVGRMVLQVAIPDAVPPPLPVPPKDTRVERPKGGPKARLLYVEQDGTAGELVLPTEGQWVIGRRDTADYRFADNGMSSMHAAFEWEAGGLVVRDLGSTNGTWVQGERVARAVLRDRDEIRLGRTLFEVILDGAVGAPAAAEVGEEAELLPDPHAERALRWLVIYVGEDGVVRQERLHAQKASLLIGDGPVGLQAQGRGLLSAHLRLDWVQGQLTVSPLGPHAVFRLNGGEGVRTYLASGDVVEAGSLELRVVALSDAKQAPLSPNHAIWMTRLRQVVPGIEMVFIDPSRAGGRVEFALWADGAAQVSRHLGQEHEPVTVWLDQAVVASVFGSIALTDFPVPGFVAAAGSAPEIAVFYQQERGDVTITPQVAQGHPAWASVLALLRAIMALA